MLYARHASGAAQRGETCVPPPYVTSAGQRVLDTSLPVDSLTIFKRCTMAYWIGLASSVVMTLQRAHPGSNPE